MLLKTFRLKIDTKSISDDGEYASFRGYASTFGNEDSYGDVIEKGAFTKTANEANGTLPMLWQHDTDEVIGTYPQMAENEHGLEVEGRIVLATQRGREAHALLKAGAIKAMSIGFTIPEGKADFDQQTQTRSIREVRLWEISLVTFPANTRAAITQVKNRELRGEADDVAEMKRELAALRAILEQRWDGSASNYSDSEWAKACILDRGADVDGKARYSLPIATPGNSYASDPDKGGVAAAAGRIGQVKNASSSAISTAYSRLAAAYRKLGLDVPPSVAEHSKTDTTEIQLREFLSGMGHKRAASALADGEAEAAETAVRTLIAEMRSHVNRELLEV